MTLTWTDTLPAEPGDFHWLDITPGCEPGPEPIQTRVEGGVLVWGFPYNISVESTLRRYPKARWSSPIPLPQEPNPVSRETTVHPSGTIPTHGPHGTHEPHDPSGG